MPQKPGIFDTRHDN